MAFIRFYSCLEGTLEKSKVSLIVYWRHRSSNLTQLYSWFTSWTWIRFYQCMSTEIMANMRWRSIRNGRPFTWIISGSIGGGNRLPFLSKYKTLKPDIMLLASTESYYVSSKKNTEWQLTSSPVEQNLSYVKKSCPHNKVNNYYILW